MSDIEGLTQFTLTGLESAIVADTSDDGSDLDAVGVRVGVTITARPEVVQLATTPPRTVRIRPAKVRIEDGVLVLPGGVEGDVRLVADTDVLGLDGHLLYDVKFGSGSVGGEQIDFGDQNFTFAAPTSDTTVDMSTVVRLAGRTPAGTQLRMVPDHVRFNDDGQMVFSSNGIDLPDPLTIEGGGGGGGDGITDVVQDVTPQLGGNLDPNGHTVGDATAADLTKLHALTPTSTELNFVDGVTAAIQAQLDAKQPLDADLTALAALTAPATKLSGIAAGATVNDTDANLKNRTNHTGSQAASTISDFATAADARITAASLYRPSGTDVAVTDGGTGASTAAAARTNLAAERAFQLNVRDFGATGDNTTNDRTAIQAALDAADGRTVYFPPGQYRIGSSLTMNPGQKIVGSIGSGFGDDTMPPAAEVSTIVALASMNAPLIVGAEASGHVRIRDLHLDGNKNSNTSTSGIVLSDATTVALEAQWVLENVFVEACAVDGIYVGLGRRAVKGHNVWSMYNGVNGFNIKGSDSGWDSCITGGNDIGFRVDAPVTRVTNGDIFGNTSAGVVVTDTLNMIHLSGNGIDKNGVHGVYIGSGAWNVQIIGNLFHSNSVTANGAGHHIFLAGDVAQTATIMGNSFGGDDGITNLPGWCVYLAGAATIFASGNTLEEGSVNLGLISDPTKVIGDTSASAALDVVVVATGTETRPSGPAVVLWVDTREDAERPTNMGDDDLWFTPNEVAGGGGDMLASVYDPNGVADDAFDRANHTGTQSADTLTDGATNKAYTATEKTKLGAITGTNTGDQTSVTGNAGTATTLATGRTINGVSFNGSANIVITPRVGTTTSSATPSIDMALYEQYNITALAAAITSVTITNGAGNRKLVIRIKDDGTARALAFGSTFAPIGVTLPTTTVISKTLYLGCIWNEATSKLDVLAVAQEA